ncbi:hypothetical protein [Pseudidiomarina sp.]|uniref:hypothetical protein n=1 Tax=Pseudidiomarina sp. TaxID=2081707 RepID=UPI003A97345B
MTFKFQGISSEYIPAQGCKAHILINMLTDTEVLTEQAILNQIGSNYRSPLQQLEGDRYGHWLIIRCEHKGQKAFALDPRHKSGDPLQDRKARAERWVSLKKVSLKQATTETERCPRAKRELQEALENKKTA